MDALTRVCISLQVSLLDVGTLGSEVVFSFWLHSTLMGNDYSAGEMYLSLPLPPSQPPCFPPRFPPFFPPSFPPFFPNLTVL